MADSSSSASTLPSDIAVVVAHALAEDVGFGDVTAALIDPGAQAQAEVVLQEPATLCGTAWFDEVFRQVGGGVATTWHYADSATLIAGTVVCELAGPARSVLTGERTALNFLQTLSGTATATRRYVDALAGTACRVLDTRKTLPGLRSAQKYAVRCGGGTNHRLGLWDAVLIKENHIAAAGGITAAVREAYRRDPTLLIEVEVESLAELDEALGTEAQRIMLDDFSLADMRAAVAVRNARAPGKELEASGGVELAGLAAIAATGVDFISIGAMTKHLHAIDFSMRFA